MVALSAGKGNPVAVVALGTAFMTLHHLMLLHAASCHIITPFSGTVSFIMVGSSFFH